MAWTYILYSPALDRYYIGQTNDIRSRLRHHHLGDTPYTSRTSDWQLVFLQELLTRTEAMRLERALKRKKNRTAIQSYLNDPRNQISRPIPLTDW